MRNGVPDAPNRPSEAGSEVWNRRMLKLSLPLLKNCFPSLVNSLAPFAVIVRIAEAEENNKLVRSAALTSTPMMGL